MGVTTSAPLRPFIRLAELPAVETLPLPRLPRPAVGCPKKNDGPVRLPMLRIAVKKRDDIVYFIRVEDPREEILRQFNAKNRHRGIHAVAMFEGSDQFRTSFEVVADGKLVFRSWEYPEARAEYNRQRKAGHVVDFIRRKARVSDELAIDEDGEGGAA